MDGCSGWDGGSLSALPGPWARSARLECVVCCADKGWEKVGVCPLASEQILMASSVHGDLYWDRSQATAPHWVLVLDGPPGTAPVWLDPCDLSAPQAARGRELAEIISRTLHKETGQWPATMALTPVQYRQQFRFAVTYPDEGPRSPRR
jgi:hypothetical protein